MNPKIIFTAVLLVLNLVLFSTNSFSKINNSSSNRSNVESLIQADLSADYTYVEVLEDGKWWMYVYDGVTLIDRYLIEE